MKKILSFGLILFALNANSQVKQIKPFIDFGPKFFIGPSMINSNVIGESTDPYEHSLKSFGYGAGFKLAFDFNEFFAVAGEIDWISNTQTFNLNSVESGELQIKATALEFPMMLRYNNSSSGYLEGGFVLSKILGVKENSSLGELDYSDLYNSKRNGLVFGLGGYLWGNADFGISAGFRFRYDLTDAVNVAVEDKVPSSLIYAYDNRITSSSNRMSLMFNLEINYDLGFIMARNPCDGRRKLLFSGR
jgi:hypothetical protein